LVFDFSQGALLGSLHKDSVPSVILRIQVVKFLVSPSDEGDLSNSSAATYSEVTTGINPAYAALGLLTTGKEG
jgi:hypothetical protein